MAHGPRWTDPRPLSRMTDACENIIFPRTTYFVGKNVLFLSGGQRAQGSQDGVAPGQIE